MRRSGCPSQPWSTRKSVKRGGQAAGLKALRYPPLRKVEAQISAAFASSFFKPLKRSSGMSASGFDLAVMAKTCGSCCEGFVAPVVTVNQAALLWMPGGGRVRGR